MKRIYSLLATVALAAMVNAQTNLVQNPGFENGLAPWGGGTGSGYTDPTISSTNPHGGTKCALYNATGTTGFYQNVPIEVGKTYTLSFWYKSVGNGTDGRVRMWSVMKNASNQAVYQTASANDDPLRNNNGYLDAATAWTQHSVQFTVTDASIVSIDVAVRVYNNSVEAVFDDFSLIDKSLSTGEVALSKHALVKNTLVEDEIYFSAASQVTIYNANGQVVKTAKVSEGQTLNVSALPKGVYLVKGMANGEQSVQKILKK